MTAAMWATNGGRLNSYRATVGNYTWVLTLKAVGWVMENLTAPSMGPVFVASVKADADIAFTAAITKAERVA